MQGQDSTAWGERGVGGSLQGPPSPARAGQGVSMRAWVAWMSGGPGRSRLPEARTSTRGRLVVTTSDSVMKARMSMGSPGRARLAGATVEPIREGHEAARSRGVDGDLTACAGGIRRSERDPRGCTRRPAGVLAAPVRIGIPVELGAACVSRPVLTRV